MGAGHRGNHSVDYHFLTGEQIISDKPVAADAIEKSTLQRIRLYLVLLAVLLSFLVFGYVWWGWWSGETGRPVSIL